MNIAILGPGEIAVKMAMTLQHLKGVTCYAVASRDQARAQAFADKYGFRHAYGSYIDMLNDEYVDLVYIATPHSHHYENIKMCLQHGKHVLVEKPFTANAAQAEEVLLMAERSGLFLAEAMWSRYMPMVDTIREVVSSNLIGRITALSANVGFPLENKERLRRPELAGGALLDLGCYALHFASMIFGDDLKSISASCTKLETGVDAQETIMLTYRDGRMANLFVTMLAECDRRAMIYGTNGYIEIENIINFESIRAYNLERKVIAEYAAPYQVTGYEYEVMAVMDAMRSGLIECYQLPHETILHTMRMMDNLRAAFGIVYPFELDPESSPTEIGEEAEKEKEMQRESTVKEISNTANNQTEEAEEEPAEESNEESNGEMNEE
ncbi:MAG: Gfo/Idh/MocA family oxidoreductase [Lachnospiraceae bacterium]|nr:Gfo/Idh/MocA family oxidoreductase [Lachnospiraceae bacterium]